MTTGTAERSYPSPRSGEMARRSNPVAKVRGSSLEELPCAQGQGRWLGGATLCPRPGTAARRSHLTPEVRGGGQEEQPQEQWVRRGRKA